MTDIPAFPHKPERKTPAGDNLFVVTPGDEPGMALRDYFAAYRYEVVEPADLLDSFERSLGRDLDDIFRNWVGEFPGLD